MKYIQSDEGITTSLGSCGPVAHGDQSCCERRTGRPMEDGSGASPSALVTVDLLEPVTLPCSSAHQHFDYGLVSEWVF